METTITVNPNVIGFMLILAIRFAVWSFFTVRLYRFLRDLFSNPARKFLNYFKKKSAPDPDKLTPKEKSTVAFALFSLTMKVGPVAFVHVAEIVRKLEIENEMNAVGKSWIDTSKQNQST